MAQPNYELDAFQLTNEELAIVLEEIADGIRITEYEVAYIVEAAKRLNISKGKFNEV